jgi:hypothetical protein
MIGDIVFQFHALIFRSSNKPNIKILMIGETINQSINFILYKKHLQLHDHHRSVNKAIITVTLKAKQ